MLQVVEVVRCEQPDGDRGEDDFADGEIRNERRAESSGEDEAAGVSR